MTQFNLNLSTAGADPGFFVGGEYRIPVVLETRRSSQAGGGGVCIPCTLPLDPPLDCQLMPHSHQLNMFKDRHGQLEHRFFSQGSNEIQHVL